MTVTYTLNNLPERFVYDQDQSRIYTPALNVYAIVNDDNSVNCPPLTYQTVDAFVKMQSVVHEIQKRERIGETKPEPLKPLGSRYVHIKCLDCTIHRVKLAILSLFIATILIAAFSIPMTYYTWPNGVLG